MIHPVLNIRASAWKPLVLASAISSLFMAPAHAQDDEVKILAPVVVTASRIEQPQTEALPHTTVITSEQIRESGASDVLSLLHQEAGVEISQNGGAGTLTSIFMRGTESRHTLILIDGVPIQDVTAIGMAAPLEHIVPDQIERIEIVRGNVSAIYGSGAIGGVIQIFTKRGTGKPSVYFSAEAGSRGTTKVSGGVSGQSGKTRYMLSLTRFETDGFSAMNTTQDPTRNPDKDGAENLSVTASVSHEWGKGHELGARVYAHDAEYSFDNDFGAAQIDEGDSRQKTFAVFSKNRFTSAWLSTVTLSNTAINRQTGVVGGTFYPFKSNTNLLQWTNEVMLSSNWMMTAGLDAAREKANKDTSSALSRSNNSVYAGLIGKIDDHSLQLNVRYDDVGDSGSDTTGYLGYGYALTPAWKVIASTSTAFLAPTLSQLYGLWGANPDLKAERALSHEVGVQYAAGQTLIRATLFDTRTRDQIIYGTTYINAAKARNHGLELSANSRLAGVDVRASLTLQNPKDDTTGDVLLKRAKTRGSLALSKGFGFWRLGGEAQYVGNRKDVGNAELTSYWLVNLNAHYKLSKAVSLYGRLENLFDRDYQTVYGYNQPSRGVFVGVRWNQ